MKPPFENDETLLAACLRGDAGAWDEFVTRYSRLIYWSIRQTLRESRYGGREDLVGDVFQDVFGKIFERSAMLRLNDARNIRKFLVVLSANLTLDRLKSISRLEGKSIYLDDPQEGAGTGAVPVYAIEAGPAEAAGRNEKQTLVAEVLGSLGAREKACLEMHFFDDRTHREIGLVLGLPQDTVSSIIRRAKEKIKDKFIKKGLDA